MESKRVLMKLYSLETCKVTLSEKKDGRIKSLECLVPIKPTFKVEMAAGWTLAWLPFIAYLSLSRARPTRFCLSCVKTWMSNGHHHDSSPNLTSTLWARVRQSASSPKPLGTNIACARSKQRFVNLCALQTSWSTEGPVQAKQRSSVRLLWSTMRRSSESKLPSTPRWVIMVTTLAIWSLTCSRKPNQSSPRKMAIRFSKVHRYLETKWTSSFLSTWSDQAMTKTQATQRKWSSSITESSKNTAAFCICQARNDTSRR